MLLKNLNSSREDWKTFTSIFSFSHNVFKRPLSKGHKESELYGKRLMVSDRALIFHICISCAKTFSLVPTSRSRSSIKVKFLFKKKKGNGCYGGISVAQTQPVSFDMVENAGIQKNAGYQNFNLFPHCLQKSSFPGLLKVCICVLKG